MVVSSGQFLVFNTEKSAKGPITGLLPLLCEFSKYSLS